MKNLVLGIVGYSVGLVILWSCSGSNGTNVDGTGTAAPVVLSTIPVGGSINVTTNSNLSITFSIAMDTASTRASISSVPAIAGTFAWDAGNTKMIWDPSNNLIGNTAYTIQISKAAKSAKNIAMAKDTTFTFTTVPDSATSIPAVVNTFPTDQALGVPVNSYIKLDFNVPMDNMATQTAISSLPAISGTFSWDNGDSKMTWIPTNNLSDTTQYTVTLKTTAKSKAGIYLAQQKTFSFKTGKTTRPPTRIVGNVMRKEDNGGIVGANVVLFNATTHSPLMRTTSGFGGAYQFKVDSGNYYLNVTAEGRLSSPLSGRPNPFSIGLDSTKIRNVYMFRDSSGRITGGISGTIEISGGVTSLAGILIVAKLSDSSSFSTTSGPDGFYVFFNLPIGSYSLKAFRSGLKMDTTSLITATVVKDNISPDHSIKMILDTGRRLEGKITFLATNNGITDITLVDPATRVAIPGLRTFNVGGIYSIQGVPPGTFIAWASYLNDGYVVDPDAIRKFGLPLVTFAPSDTLKTLDFDVTGAVTIYRPTNPAENLIPARIKSMKPYFVWKPYSSAKQYIIEVVDQSGARIWGGWDSTGKILHKPFDVPTSGLDSIQFNFDSTAVEPLKMGGTYAWKVYADFTRNPTVGELRSSSEDLRGLFVPGVDSIIVDDSNSVSLPRHY